ncbi:MAG: methylmalonyl Co-A mutase-associated GTPase MeaB, partial [Blastocatellia bacterium]
MARAISIIENGDPGASEILKGIHGRTSRGLTVGITGAPGSGKSSLVDRLALHYRELGHRVGILAIDPSSPFTGGALLGDRIRMQGLAGDEGVFIRSMATRGTLGGLARGTIEAAEVLAAAGYDRILIETVGVGQDEVEIIKAADITVVVLVPGMGDDIQAIKAGIMEIGDIFVINKSDREGVERTERELIGMLEMSDRADGWQPPIVRTVAIRNVGVEALAQSIGKYAKEIAAVPVTSPGRVEAASQRLLGMIAERLLSSFRESDLSAERLRELATAVVQREVDPYTVVDQLFFVSPEEPEETREREEKLDKPAKSRHLQHLGVAVVSIDEALKFWRDGLGLELHEVETVSDQGVRVAMLPVGDSRIELLEATGDETPVGKFLSRRGAGIHHLCVEVADLPASLEKLKAAGIRLIDEEPRPGAGGALVAFVHPASTGGVLLELTQS